jgi:hypothetical protein
MGQQEEAMGQQEEARGSRRRRGAAGGGEWQQEEASGSRRRRGAAGGGEGQQEGHHERDSRIEEGGELAIINGIQTA